MKSSFWYTVSLKIVPFMYVWLTRAWFSTCRLQTHGQEYMDQVKARTTPIVATFWHYSILYAFYYLRKESAVVMVSASKDGEYINRIAQRLGYETVRGSRKKGGLQAIKALIRFVRDGTNAGIVADGSQGPARVVQAGSIVLASRSGAPILPMLWSCSCYKRFASWDGTVIPYPFSKVDVFLGEPLDIPPKIKSDEIEKHRLILEKRMNDLYVQAWSLYDQDGH